MNESVEETEGFVVDIACIRKWPKAERLSRAERHTRACSLEGHCIESGYALVDDTGSVELLDTHATNLIIEVVRGSRRETGVRARAWREVGTKEAKTIDVRETT